MKILLRYIIVLLTPCLLFAQNEIPTEAINGEYQLLEAEQGVNRDQLTKTRLFQYGLFAGEKVLAIAACSRCMPIIYKYQEEDSKELGTPVFMDFNGYNVIAYDNESFVMIKMASIGSEDWTDFSYSNFYSKSQAKVDAMTHQKIKEFIINISE